MALTDGEREIIREQAEDARPTGPLCPLCGCTCERHETGDDAWTCDSEAHSEPLIWFDWELTEPAIDADLAAALAMPAR